MPVMTSRTIRGISTYPSVVTSPATCTSPVVTRVSTATRLRESCSSRASRMRSEIWSQILSGCPSVTDSEVNRRSGEVIEALPGWTKTSLVVVRIRMALSGEQIENTISHRRFAPGGLAHYNAARVDDHDAVTFGGEPLRPPDGVEDEIVAALAGDLLAAQLQQLFRIGFGLGAETDDGLVWPASRREARQDIRVPDQAERHPVAGRFLLDLAVFDGLRAIVGDGSGHDDDVCVAGRTRDRGFQFGGGTDRFQGDGCRYRRLEVGADQRDTGASHGSGSSDRDSLSPAGAVADEPHRVKWFTRAARGHQHALADKVLWPGDGQGCSDNVVRLRHPAGTDVLASQLA